MRTIRLRFWNTDVTPAIMEYCTLNDISALERAKGKRVMLSTDLFDMSGKEIFEGDIISKQVRNKTYASNVKECEARFLIGWKTRIENNDETEVKWYNTTQKEDFDNPAFFNDEPGFYAKEIYNEKNYQCHDWSEYANCTIIGNEHQNSELLQKEELVLN